jgi:hypothetical protein
MHRTVPDANGLLTNRVFALDIPWRAKLPMLALAHLADADADADGTRTSVAALEYMTGLRPRKIVSLVNRLQRRGLIEHSLGPDSSVLVYRLAGAAGMPS